MATYLLEYDLCADYLERRPQFRAEHLGLVQRAHDDGLLILGGALTDPADRALLVWRCGDEDPVRAFVAVDPYVTNGLVTQWRVRNWAIAVPG